MEHQRIILDSSPWFVFVCAALAGGIAFLLYNSKSPWSKTWNHVLFGFRFIMLFLLMFLLLGPVVRQISNYFEKPVMVILKDNSSSVAQTTDSVTLAGINTRLNELAGELTEKGFEVKSVNLDGDETNNDTFDGANSDLHSALRNIVQRNEGRNISGVVFATDGIYTTGLSPLYGNYNFPVYAVGLGDSIQRTDLAIRNVSYNRIAYQGNKFPVRVEVQARNFINQPVKVTLSQKGKIVAQETKNAGDNTLLTFDFTPSADEQGIQKLDIRIEEQPGESNTLNNRTSVFVEVVEGKKKILLVAPAAHPDIKPLREVVEQNSNYEFLLHIPGLREDDIKSVQPDKVDLVIFHQAPDLRGKTTAVFQQFLKTKASLLFIAGQQTDLRLLAQNDLPIRIESQSREFDQVTPVVNASFSNFSLSPEATTVFQDFPPVSVHFGKIGVRGSATPLLFQKVGSVATNKPLLAVDNQDGRRIGLMLGEGLWRWRLNEFDRTEKTAGFDELFNKLIQYLSTTDDKRKFKSYPIRQDFSETEPVIFESQVYNDIFEPVYGNEIAIEVRNESERTRNYSYVTSPGNNRYQIGDLDEGIHRYRASTVINGTTEEVRGEFAVVAKQTELQNLTADFDLLRKLAGKTGGQFYAAGDLSALHDNLVAKEATNIIHSEETYDSLVNLKWVFWLALAFISMEWFTRKFFGSY